MKKRILLSAILATMAIAGCTSQKTTDTKQTAVQTNAQISAHLTKIKLEDISWTKVQLPFDKELNVNTSKQALNSSLSVGPVLAYQIPLTYGAITISLDSFIEDKNLFASNMVLLDQNNKIVLTRNFKDFTYRPAQLIIPDLVENKITYIPTREITELKLLIYTTKDDLITTTETLHPAKAFARAHNTVEPDLKNPIAHHSFTGKLALKIGSRHLEVLRSEQPQAMTDSANQYSQSYYESAIRSAVKKGNLEQAIKLRDEARGLGIAGMDKVFIDAIKNSQ